MGYVNNKGYENKMGNRTQVRTTQSTLYTAFCRMAQCVSSATYCKLST